jgi:hypothetical protein
LCAQIRLCELKFVDNKINVVSVAFYKTNNQIALTYGSNRSHNCYNLHSFIITRMEETKQSGGKRSPFEAMQARRRAERRLRNRMRHRQRRRQLRRRLMRRDRMLTLRYRASVMGVDAIYPSDSTNGSVISADSDDTESD